MPSPIDFVISMIKKNPQIANNPQAQEYLKILESGDSARGEEVARNLCETYGVSQEDGVKQAKSFFNNFPFGGN